MAQSGQRRRYIPFRKRDLLLMLLEDGKLSTQKAMQDFQWLCKLIEKDFHLQFFEKSERLKDDYYPINPDLKRGKNFSREEADRASKDLVTVLKEVLNDANFDLIPREDVREAFNLSPILDLKLQVDENDFEFVEFYARGSRMDRFEKKTLFGLRRRVFEEEVLERVVVLVRFKPKEYFEARNKRTLSFEPGSILIKLFKDVPKSDLEILFPNTMISMHTKDLLMLMVPAIVGGIPLMVSKVLPAVIWYFFALATAYFGYYGRVEESQLKEAIAAFSAGIALAGFCFKQWLKYKNKRYEFQKRLSDNLYFRNLVNNVGVFHLLIDQAEEEECKETFLAYYFLTVETDGLTEPELDKKVEEWFEFKHGIKLDFHSIHAARKLLLLQLGELDSSGRLKVVSFEEGLRRLDEACDSYFLYAKPN